jgi:hypothetical protein
MIIDHTPFTLTYIYNIYCYYKIGESVNCKTIILIEILTIVAMLCPPFINAFNSSEEINLGDSLIVKPKVGYLYVHDREVVPLGGRVTVIIGQITLIANSRGDIRFDRVEFWVNREIKNRDSRPPYEWTWNERTIGWNTLRIIAFKGERTISDDMKAFVYNTERMP